MLFVVDDITAQQLRGSLARNFYVCLGVCSCRCSSVYVADGCTVTKGWRSITIKSYTCFRSPKQESDVVDQQSEGTCDA